MQTLGLAVDRPLWISVDESIVADRWTIVTPRIFTFLDASCQ